MTVLAKAGSKLLFCSGQAVGLAVCDKPEAKEFSLLEAAINQRIVKTEQTEKSWNEL